METAGDRDLCDSGTVLSTGTPPLRSWDTERRSILPSSPTVIKQVKPPPVGRATQKERSRHAQVGGVLGRLHEFFVSLINVFFLSVQSSGSIVPSSTHLPGRTTGKWMFEYLRSQSLLSLFSLVHPLSGGTSRPSRDAARRWTGCRRVLVEVPPKGRPTYESYLPVVYDGATQSDTCCLGVWLKDGPFSCPSSTPQPKGRRPTSPLVDVERTYPSTRHDNVKVVHVGQRTRLEHHLLRFLCLVPKR